MKKVLSLLLCLCLMLPCFCICGSATGKTYYINSITGNDSNTGTDINNPWKSVENLRTLTINAGDSILFACDGIYTCDSLKISCEGTENQPIVISSYGNGSKPLLTTAGRNDILELIDCSFVTVENLEITAPNGGGIWVYTVERESNGIVLQNLTIHNIQNFTVNSRDSQSNPTDGRACIMVKNLCYPATSTYRVNDITVKDCEMYDCGNGLLLWGSLTEDSYSPWDNDDTNDVTIVYNKNALVENCYFHDMDAEGMIIGMTDNALVKNCKFINCCQGTGTDENGEVVFYTAPVWYWGGLNSTVENCEIAGAKNKGDGMAVDFDSWTNNCTYQYIYSHDNVRFICTCPYDNGQSGNTVRYCLSVNDNAGRNSISNGEYDFSFYNNTIINSANFVMNGARNMLFANNIITGNLSCNFYWTRKCVDDETGDTYLNECTGIFTNNCLWGVCVPACFKNNYICNPGFIGLDENDINSYKLSKYSCLIGKGIGIEDAGDRDFYGNALTDTHNIGCYEGTGEDEAVAYIPLQNVIKLLSTVIGEIYQLISDLANKYWLF